MSQILLVAIGGAIGSVLRYLIGIRLNAGWVDAGLSSGFPIGTVVANVAGCFLIGLGYVAMQQIDNPQTFHQLRALLIIGLLGGFTTFSTFSLETLQLISVGLWQKALLNIIASLTLCLLGTFAGMTLGRVLIR